MPVFVPPNRGSPFTRLGGATRGASTDDLPRIEALVPEEPGSLDANLRSEEGPMAPDQAAPEEPVQGIADLGARTPR